VQAAQLTPRQLARLTETERTELAEAIDRWERANESLYDFITRVSPGHIAPHHLAPLVELLERAERERLNIAVSVPPGHGKTDLLLHAIVRRLVRSPEHLVGYVTYGLDLSYPKSREARGIAERAGIKLASDSAAVQEWNTAQGGGLKASAVSAGLTGRHVDLLIFDDPFKSREDAESPRQRDTVYDFFTSTATTRCKANASRVVVHTRWHDDDLIGRLEKLGGWHVINLPAIRDPLTGEPSDDGEVLLPEVQLPSGSIFGYSRELLAERRAQNEYDWHSLYQGKPRPRGGKVFERDPARYLEPHREGARLILSVDCAGTESTKADATAAVAVLAHGRGEQLMLDVLEVELIRKEPKDAAPLLRAFQQRHGGSSMLIESTRDGKAIARALEGIDQKLLLTEVVPIGDKFTRAQPLASAWNQGRVRLPMHAPWLSAFLDEMDRFTGINDRHDDQVDALAQAWNYAMNAPVAIRPKLIGAPRGGAW
jgi:predicted phage terminase large subunit-like protein